MALLQKVEEDGLHRLCGHGYPLSSFASIHALVRAETTSYHTSRSWVVQTGYRSCQPSGRFLAPLLFRNAFLKNQDIAKRIAEPKSFRSPGRRLDRRPKSASWQ